MALDILNAFLRASDHSLGNWLEGSASHSGLRQPKRRRRDRSRPQQPKKVTRVSWGYTPAQAFEAGFRWASYGPKGNLICVHASERTAKAYLAQNGLRNAGCVVEALRAHD